MNQGLMRQDQLLLWNLRSWTVGSPFLSISPDLCCSAVRCSLFPLSFCLTDPFTCIFFYNPLNQNHYLKLECRDHHGGWVVTHANSHQDSGPQSCRWGRKKKKEILWKGWWCEGFCVVFLCFEYPWIDFVWALQGFAAGWTTIVVGLPVFKVFVVILVYCTLEGWKGMAGREGEKAEGYNITDMKRTQF